MTEQRDKMYIEKLKDIEKSKNNIRTTLRIPESIITRKKFIFPDVKMVDFFDLLVADLSDDLMQRLMQLSEKESLIPPEIESPRRKNYLMRRHTSENLSQVAKKLSIPRDTLISKMAHITLSIFEHNQKKKLAIYETVRADLDNALELLDHASSTLNGKLDEEDRFIHHLDMSSGYLNNVLMYLDNFQKTGIWEEN